MAEADRKLVGVGGWLAFFAIGVGALTPLRLVTELAKATAPENGAPAIPLQGSWLFLVAGEWTITLLTVALCWFMVWRLLKVETWATVRIVIAGIWIVGALRPALEMLLFGFWLNATTVVNELGPEAAAGLLSASLWTAYFLRSRRVRNTYPRQGMGKEAVEIFS